MGLGPLWPSNPSRATGYGQFRWGESFELVRRKVPALRRRKTEPEPSDERRLLDLIHKATNHKSSRADRRSKGNRRHRPPPRTPRLSAHAYWIALGRLPARVVLLFVDKRLYGADVGALYKPHQRRAVADVVHMLVEKYGQPEHTRGGETSDAPRISEFDTGDGRLELLQRPVGKHRVGMLVLRYRAVKLHKEVTEYLAGLETELRAKEQDAARRLKAADKAAARDRRQALLKHL